MKGSMVAGALLALSPLAWSPSVLAADWLVGYSFLYSDTENRCAFMRFRADAHSVEQADQLYLRFQDALADHVTDAVTLVHTLPSAALAKGETGEQMAAEFLSKGVGACTVANEPVEGLLFVSAFPCDYQNEAQMCIRMYIDAGAKDLTAEGINPGPAAIGGLFIKRDVWDASTALVFGGSTRVPHAVATNLDHAAATVELISGVSD